MNWIKNALISLLYLLGFSLSGLGAEPGVHQTVFIDRPDYQDVAHPPEYLSASSPELRGNGDFLALDPTVDVASIVWSDLDEDGFGDVPSDVSQELSEHYLLNQLVEDLEGDPIALAAYVQNEIKLDRAFQVPTEGQLKWFESRTIFRGAYGVFLEKQGSPWEQCALLVYLLRRAGYPAAVVEAPKYVDPYDPDLPLYTMYMRTDRLDRMFGCRVDESLTPNIAISVDYPWVVVNDQKDGSGHWQHLFPWIKDIVLEEGFDPYSFLPDGYDSGEEWLERYLRAYPRIGRC